MNLLGQLENEILNEIPLSSVLRRAKVLAYQLRSDEFKDWIEYEPNGYPPEVEQLPDYRRFRAPAFGNFLRGALSLSNAPLSVQNLPEWVQERSNSQIRDGIGELESLLRLSRERRGESPRVLWPAELLPLVNRAVNAVCVEAWYLVPVSTIHRVLESTRNRLLTFVLELADRYPEQVSGELAPINTIPAGEVRQIFNYKIMGGTHNFMSAGTVQTQGGTVPVFDQRNQHVGTQYNAGRDIAFQGVLSREDFISELLKVQSEIITSAEAGIIDEDVATDAEYQVRKVLQQAQKPTPDKEVITSHLDKAKTFLDAVSAASTLITALTKAGEVAERLFGP